MNTWTWALVYFGASMLTAFMWWRPMLRMAKPEMSRLGLLVRLLLGSIFAWPLLFVFFFIARAKNKQRE